MNMEKVTKLELAPHEVSDLIYGGTIKVELESGEIIELRFDDHAQQKYERGFGNE